MNMYEYSQIELEEPDWRRFPGWKDVTENEWRSSTWQRANSILNTRQMQNVFGSSLSPVIYDGVADDQVRFATMSLRITPHMVNTICPNLDPSSSEYDEAFLMDPVRRYMIVMSADRDMEWLSHPMAQRDSLHEADMWAVEGLTHRYPNKVLAELTSTCAQYCGHCTRMDLVGSSTEQVTKRHFQVKPGQRLADMIDYLHANPQVRDVVVSGGDVANVPWARLEAFVADCIGIGTIKDIRLASKSLIGMPQFWLQPQVIAGTKRLAELARERHVSLALHTHCNAAQSVTPLVAEASFGLLDAGLRDIRNQGVLLNGVNDSRDRILDLSFSLLDSAGITPYYMYMCDMIPNSEHWRGSLAQAIEIQEQIMGYLPGFATPRLVCDVPFVGKRWVHQAMSYDRRLGISTWHGSSGVEGHYYDPVQCLGIGAQSYWRDASSAKKSREITGSPRFVVNSIVVMDDSPLFGRRS